MLALPKMERKTSQTVKYGKVLKRGKVLKLPMLAQYEKKFKLLSLHFHPNAISHPLISNYRSNKSNIS